MAVNHLVAGSSPVRGANFKSTMKQLEIYYDIISPYAYLGLELFARSSLFRETSFTLTPVSLGTILATTNNPGPANIPPKRKVALLDFCMQCKLHEVPAMGPPNHPFNPLPAMRFIHCIQDQNLRFKAALTLNRECWALGLPIDNEDLIADCLKKTDFFQKEWEDIYLFTKANNGRQLLKEATAKALENDVFGVPTFRYNNINFWGSDRLPLLQEFIANPDKFANTNYLKMLNTTPGKL